MTKYTREDLENMKYGVVCADMRLNADDNPAIHNYLISTLDLLDYLLAEKGVK